MKPENNDVVARRDIARGLRRLGVRPGDVLLVHSSLKSLGWVEGGAEGVIDALLDAVGPAGTVMVPTITGQAEHSPEHPPVFDLRNTPGWTGTIPETFRRRDGARRSLHPTHSVAAIGPQADFLVRDHLEAPSPCGPGSPYLRLADLAGKIVFIGVSLECCTVLHGVEELAHCDYHMQPEPALAAIIDARGRRLRKYVRIHRWGTPRNFRILEPALTARNIMRRGCIGAAEVRVVQARPLIETALELLEENPRALCASG